MAVTNSEETCGPLWIAFLEDSIMMRVLLYNSVKFTIFTKIFTHDRFALSSYFAVCITNTYMSDVFPEVWFKITAGGKQMLRHQSITC